MQMYLRCVTCYSYSLAMALKPMVMTLKQSFRGNYGDGKWS